MGCFYHPNFAIDQEVDEAVKRNFEELVSVSTEKCVDSDIKDPVMRRGIAIYIVLLEKEQYKLEIKAKAARRKGRAFNKKKTRQRVLEELSEAQCKRRKSLLKKCLQKMHRRSKKEEKLNRGNYLNYLFFFVYWTLTYF